MNKYRNSFPRIWLTAQHWTCAVFFKLRILTLGGVSHAEFSRNAARNMSLSVAHSETNEGRPALSWNMSAPCRLEAEVWPCQMAVTLGGGCTEVPGFRRNISSGWEENISMVWVSERASERVWTLLHLSRSSPWWNRNVPGVLLSVLCSSCGTIRNHHTLGNPYRFYVEPSVSDQKGSM